MYQKCLAEFGMGKDATEMVKAVGDFAVIGFYYFLLVGEYPEKNKEMKQRKRCSSSWKIQCFFIRILKYICSNLQ